tara:strand:+ start:1054 stop:1197 length:144 start_codon:yes stop_codon:yes gene_type:complete
MERLEKVPAVPSVGCFSPPTEKISRLRPYFLVFVAFAKSFIEIGPSF